jgi:N-carbamoylputrescine amidase
VTTDSAAVRVTVCELRDDPAHLADDWDGLTEHCLAERSDLVLLPEMPFDEWPCATRPADPARWNQSVAAHGYWMRRIGDLGAAVVAGTRPVVRSGRRHNEAFVWSRETGVVPVHDKRNLPDEDGFWEASWYEPGDGGFDVVTTSTGTIGFLVCTELWFPERAREYGRAGAQIVAAPRSTPLATRERWFVAGRAAALIGGAFCISSNRAGASSGIEWAGTGWVIDPEGSVLGVTLPERPFVTIEVDPAVAAAARATYPRYVPD